jgi:hypothetical protein
LSGSHGAFVSRHAYKQLCVCCAILTGFLLLSPVLRGQELQLAPLPLSSADATLTSLMTPVAQNALTASAEDRVTPQETAPSPQESQEKRSGTSNDRILWTMPNFLAVEDADKIPSLTPGQKFKVVARGVFDPVEFVLVGFVAGLGQSNSNPSYGQGAEGYAKRYGTSYADNSTRNFMPRAVSPSLLHQDPRYYQLGHGGFLKPGQALGRVIIKRSDSGHTQLSYSVLMGGVSAAAIATDTHHPGVKRARAT